MPAAWRNFPVPPWIFPVPRPRTLTTQLVGFTDAMNDFVSIVAGTLSPVEFFHPDNLNRLLAAA